MRIGHLNIRIHELVALVLQVIGALMITTISATDSDADKKADRGMHSELLRVWLLNISRKEIWTSWCCSSTHLLRIFHYCRDQIQLRRQAIHRQF
jgi:hypothetical protein